MAQVRLVAATRPPLNNAGCMLPVFKKKDGKFFEVGGGDFSKVELEELIKDNAAIPFESITPKGLGFNIKELRWSNEEPDHHGYSAYILYLSKEALACLGGEEPILEIGSKYSAVFSRPTKKAAQEWGDYLFLLISREGLVSGVVPEVTVLCKDLIDKALTERILDRNRTAPTLIEGEHDDLAQLAQVLMNIATTETIQDAIRYYGSMLLLSPMAKNFRVWLNLVLDRWGHQSKHVEFWKDLSLGVYDDAERRAIERLTWERMTKVEAHITYVSEPMSASLEPSAVLIPDGISEVVKGYFPSVKAASSLADTVSTQPIIIYEKSLSQDSPLKKKLVFVGGSSKPIYPIGEKV